MAQDQKKRVLNLLDPDFIQSVRPVVQGDRRVRLSQIAEAILTLDGKPYSLRDRKIMRDFVMDNGYPQILVMGGRQIEKSTTIAARMVVMSLAIPGIRSIYIAPAYEHRREFARNVLKRKIIEGIPNWKDLFPTKQEAYRVYELRFINGSVITTGYSPREGDTLRGKSGDVLYVDEIQDMRIEAVRMAEYFLFHSDFQGGLRVYTGTAKTVDHTIHYYWENSTKGEFVIRCRQCGKDNVPSPANVGEWGLKCAYCGADLKLEDGRVVFARPVDGTNFIGIRFPQIVSPFVVKNPVTWHREIWGKIQRDGLTPQVMNEIFAQPSGSVDRLVTSEEIKALCNPYMANSLENLKYAPDGIFVVGIDWGTGRVSNTAMSILEVAKSGIPKVIFVKRWSGASSQAAVSEIIEILKRLPRALVVADFGFSGPELLPKLWRLFEGTPIHVYAMYNTAGTTPIRYRPHLRAFTVGLHGMLSTLFGAIKNADIVFPRWEDTRHYVSEFTAWYIDADRRRSLNRIFNHDYGRTVDVSITVAMALTMRNEAIREQIQL